MRFAPFPLFFLGVRRKDRPGTLRGRQGGRPFALLCVYSSGVFQGTGFRRGASRPFTMLRAGPGLNRSTGIDKLVASRTVVQS
jgi:hypothetical protein